MLVCQLFNLGISASQAKANLQEEEIGSWGENDGVEEFGTGRPGGGDTPMDLHYTLHCTQSRKLLHKVAMNSPNKEVLGGSESITQSIFPPYVRRYASSMQEL
jgi:hypothetical protein